MGGTSPSSGTTVQKSEPWSEQKPYLEFGFQQAQDLYNAPGPSYYPFQTYVPFSDYTQQALQGQAQYASTPNPLLQGSQQQTANIMGGNYLYSNPAMPYFGAAASGQLAGVNPGYGLYSPWTQAGSIYNNPAFGYMGGIAGGQNVGSNPIYGLLGGMAQGGMSGANPLYGLMGGYAQGQGIGANPMYQYLGGVAAGNEVGGNPYLDAMFGQASKALGERFRYDVNPQIDAYFNNIGGSMESPAMMQTLQRALQDQYTSPMIDLATKMYGGAYESDQARRMQAAGALGQLYQGDVGNQMAAAQMLGGAYRGDVGDIFGASQALGGTYQGDIGNLLQAAGGLSGAYGTGVNQLLQAVGGVSGLGSQDIQNMLYGAGQLGNTYQGAFGNMMQALGMSPEMYNLGYTPYQQLGMVGGAYEGKSMEQLQADMAKYQYEQNLQADKLANYMNMLQGNYGNTSTSTTTGGNMSNPFADFGSMGTAAMALPKMIGI